MSGDNQGLGYLILIFGGLFLVLFAILIAVFIYQAKVLSKVAKLEGRKDAFLAWIPVGNVYLICKMAKVSFLIWVISFVITLKFFPESAITPTTIYTTFALNKIFKRYSVKPIILYASYVVPFCILIAFGQCYANAKKIEKDNLNGGYGGNFNNYNTFNDYNNYNNNNYNDYNNRNY